VLKPENTETRLEPKSAVARYSPLGLNASEVAEVASPRFGRVSRDFGERPVVWLTEYT